MFESIPPRDLTVTRLRITEIRIRAYWKTHGHLPARLADLPILKGRDSATIDGWGRAIKYDVTGTSTVVLSSLGAERVVGTRDLNDDIVVSFDTREK